MKLNPLEIDGPWKLGFTLDLHTVSSQFLGNDANGHPQFDTTRSELGEALYRCKYQNDRAACRAVADAAAAFVREKGIRADVVVAIPPSRPRSTQPLSLIASHFATQLNLRYDADSVVKVKDTPELKSLEDFDERERVLKGAFQVLGKTLKGKSVILFDDLYRSGASMAEVARTLAGQGEVASVTALALTRTRSKT